MISGNQSCDCVPTTWLLGPRRADLAQALAERLSHLNTDVFHQYEREPAAEFASAPHRRAPPVRPLAKHYRSIIRQSGHRVHLRVAEVDEEGLVRRRLYALHNLERDRWWRLRCRWRDRNGQRIPARRSLGVIPVQRLNACAKVLAS